MVKIIGKIREGLCLLPLWCWVTVLVIFTAAVCCTAIILIIRASGQKKIIKHINNNSYMPPLPISRNISMKKRYVYGDFEPKNKKRRKKQFCIELTELPGGIVHNIRCSETMRMGRSRKCDLRLKKDKTASPVQCTFYIWRGRLILTNNNPVNITCLNGVEMNEASELISGDLLLIGEKEYRVDSWGKIAHIP